MNNITTTTAPANTTPAQADDNHMSSVRGMLIEQMRALRSATTPDQLTMESERAKSVALVAQAITSAARVEVEYVRTCTDEDKQVAFLQPQDEPAQPPAVTYPAPDRLVHRIRR